MRIAERIYIVGSGRAGFSMTDDFDCHVYAVDGGDEIALIDAGGGRATDAIVANLRADGLDPAQVRHILLTHAHGDHAAGTASMRGALGSPAVYASSEAAAWIRDGDEHAISLDAARASGMYPADVRLLPCPIDRELADGDELRVGALRLRAIATPGHSRGHLSYLMGDQLFAGDALFYGGRVVLQNTGDGSLQDTVATIERLAAERWDALLPGHLAFSLKDGHRHAEAALAVTRRLGIPPQLL